MKADSRGPTALFIGAPYLSALASPWLILLEHSEIESDSKCIYLSDLWPPKLYGPRAPIIVLKTSNCSTRESGNTGSLLGVIGKPRIIHILQLIQDQYGVTTILQYLVQK
jgi:hypothetical protein